MVDELFESWDLKELNIISAFTLQELIMFTKNTELEDECMYLTSDDEANYIINELGELITIEQINENIEDWWR